MTVPIEPTPMTAQLAFVRAQEEKTHRQRRVTNWIVVAACVATLGIVTWEHSDLSHQLGSLANRAFGKKAVAAQAKSAKEFRDEIILCEENHTNRNLEQINHLRVEPLAKGCPPDHLLPPRAMPAPTTRTVVVTIPVVHTVIVPTTQRVTTATTVACRHPGHCR